MSINVDSRATLFGISIADNLIHKFQREVLGGLRSQDVGIFNLVLYVDPSGVHEHYFHLDLLSHMNSSVKDPPIPTAEEISGKYYVMSNVNDLDSIPDGIKGIFFNVEPPTRRMHGLTAEIIEKLKPKIQFIGTNCASIGTREIHRKLSPIMPMENAQLHGIPDGLYTLDVVCGEPIHDAIPLLQAHLTPLHA